MKLLLVQPPIRDFYDTVIRLQPLGLAYLKAFIKRELPSVSVKIIDLHCGWGRQTVALPPQLKYLTDYYNHDISPFSTFEQFFHFGADFSAVKRLFEAEAPDIIGISCNYTAYLQEALQIARIAKELSTIVVMGGAHVTAAPQTVLAHPAVDYIIQGEGEVPLTALLRNMMLNSNQREFINIPGLGYKKNNELCFNEPVINNNLDDLPFPDFSDLKANNYKYAASPLTFVITTRGCPYKCAFCSINKTSSVYRRRSNTNIIAEMKTRYSEGYRVFDIEDDNFTYAISQTKDLLRTIIAEFSHKNILLTAMNGLSYLHLDEELIALMVKAGFKTLNIALVSTNRDLLQKLGRPHNIKKFLETVDTSNKCGLATTAYQIIGLPGDTIANMLDTLVFMAKLPLILGASLFYLTPGCALADNLTIGPDDFITARSTAINNGTSSFDRDELYTLFVITRIINFLKSLPQSDCFYKTTSNFINDRKNIGLEILNRLFNTGKLCSFDGVAYNPNNHFKSALFFDLWHKLNWQLPILTK